MARIIGDVYCAALNFRKLDDAAASALLDARIDGDASAVLKLRSAIGLKECSVAIVNKCNAVIIIVVASRQYASEFVYYRMKDAWDRCSTGGVMNHQDSIQLFSGIKVVRFLGQCAVGLHSVVIGDSQVLGQIDDAFEVACECQNDAALRQLRRWIRQTARTVRDQTGLFDGKFSLERLACEEVVSSLSSECSVALIGVGRSGRLIAEILLKETALSLLAANRTTFSIQSEHESGRVESVPFGDWGKIMHAHAVIFALDRNEGTSEAAQTLLRVLQHIGASPELVVDMSEHPLISALEYRRVFRRVVLLKDLGERAQKIVDKRASASNRARQIIDRAALEGMESIRSILAECQTAQQLRTIGSALLEQRALHLLEMRDVALVAARAMLHSERFIEVQTPFIVGVSTDPPRVDSGTAIAVTWPGRGAYLRQSNQLYKQMIVVSGQSRIFEIGPFWRGEESRSHRHLEETIGLDVEWRSSDLDTTIALAYRLVLAVRASLHDWCTKKGIEMKELLLPKESNLPIFEYSEAIAMLQGQGFPIATGEDLGIWGEARLGEIVRKQNLSDIFVVRRYPSAVKKFYTHSNDDDSTETFDFVLAGWEITSGAVRETRRANMERKMRLSGVDPKEYEFYLSILHNAPQHSGFGLGFDRLMARLLGLGDVRQAVVFPRTFEQLIP
jgi:aspartyl/asparaginyl-tRNA synthetase